MQDKLKIVEIALEPLKLQDKIGGEGWRQTNRAGQADPICRSTESSGGRLSALGYLKTLGAKLTEFRED